MTITRRVITENLTIPANSTPTSPYKVTVAMEWYWCWSIDVRTPAGHNGTTGYAILSNGIPLVPWGLPLQYLITNDENRSFTIDAELHKFVTIQCINQDVWTHGLYVRFEVTPVTLITNAQERAAIVNVL